MLQWVERQCAPARRKRALTAIGDEAAATARADPVRFFLSERMTARLRQLSGQSRIDAQDNGKTRPTLSGAGTDDPGHRKPVGWACPACATGLQPDRLAQEFRRPFERAGRDPERA